MRGPEGPVRGGVTRCGRPPPRLRGRGRGKTSRLSIDPIPGLPALDNSFGQSFIFHDARRCLDPVRRVPVRVGPEAASRGTHRGSVPVHSPGNDVSETEEVPCGLRLEEVAKEGVDKCVEKGATGEGNGKGVERRCDNRADGSKKSLATVVVFLGLLCGHWCYGGAEALAGSQKYSTRTVRTRYGTLRGVEARSSTSVETYYGVPYATPPVGSIAAIHAAGHADAMAWH